MPEKFKQPPTPEEPEKEVFPEAEEERARELIEFLTETPAGKYMEGEPMPDMAELRREHPDFQSKEAEKQELEAAQTERRADYEITVGNFRAHGATDEQIDDFWESIERMEVAEKERGRLFSNQHTFLVWERMSNPDDDFDPGFESGFEQGQTVTVKRSSGELEKDWVFVGIDKDTNLAIVRKDMPDLETDEVGRFKKEYPLDQLMELNQASN